MRIRCSPIFTVTKPMAGSSKGGIIAIVIIVLLFVVIPIVGYVLVAKGAINFANKIMEGGANEQFESVSRSLGGASSSGWGSGPAAGTIASPFTGGNKVSGAYDISFSDHCEF